MAIMLVKHWGFVEDIIWALNEFVVTVSMLFNAKVFMIHVAQLVDILWMLNIYHGKNVIYSLTYVPVCQNAQLIRQATTAKLVFFLPNNPARCSPTSGGAAIVACLREHTLASRFDH
jgi:hypothetical protein